MHVWRISLPWRSVHDAQRQAFSLRRVLHFVPNNADMRIITRFHTRQAAEKAWICRLGCEVESCNGQ